MEGGRIGQGEKECKILWQRVNSEAKEKKTLRSKQERINRDYYHGGQLMSCQFFVDNKFQHI